MTDSARFSWTVLLPVKVLARAKSRLAALAGDRRGELALALASDTVCAVLACEEVARVIVVTSDPVAVDVSFLGVFNVRGDQRHLHIDSMFHPAGRLHRAWILGDLGVVVRQNSLHRQNSRRQSEW